VNIKLEPGPGAVMTVEMADGTKHVGVKNVSISPFFQRKSATTEVVRGQVLVDTGDSVDAFQLVVSGETGKIKKSETGADSVKAKIDEIFAAKRKKPAADPV
jgi:hypothetical protein